MEQFSLPGLRRVAAINPDALPSDIRKMQLAGMIPVIAASPSMMNIFGDSLLEFSKDADNKLSCSLSFSSLVLLPNIPTAFIAEDRMGQCRLIGALEPPFPKVSYTYSSGKSSADKREINYKVEWEGVPVICNFMF